MTTRPGSVRGVGRAVTVAAALALSLCPAVSTASERPSHGVAAGVAIRTGAVRAAAWRSDNQLLAGARLRLRNAITGRIDATAVADSLGHATFRDVVNGTYALELVNESGKVLVVGQSFQVAPGDTVATFVRLPAPVSWFDGFFTNAALAIASTAAATGVTAVAPGDRRPVSARQ